MNFLLYYIFILSTLLWDISKTELAKKVVHDNGVKEFTIIREIKRHQCSCSCMCVPKDVIKDADISEFLPPTSYPTAVTKFPYEKTPSITRLQPTVVIDMVTKHMEEATSAVPLVPISTTSALTSKSTTTTTTEIKTTIPTTTTSKTIQSSSSREKQLSLNEISFSHDEGNESILQEKKMTQFRPNLMSREGEKSGEGLEKDQENEISNDVKEVEETFGKRINYTQVDTSEISSQTTSETSPMTTLETSSQTTSETSPMTTSETSPQTTSETSPHMTIQTSQTQITTSRTSSEKRSGKEKSPAWLKISIGTKPDKANQESTTLKVTIMRDETSPTSPRLTTSFATKTTTKNPKSGTKLEKEDTTTKAYRETTGLRPISVDDFSKNLVTTATRAYMTEETSTLSSSITQAEMEPQETTSKITETTQNLETTQELDEVRTSPKLQIKHTSKAKIQSTMVQAKTTGLQPIFLENFDETTPDSTSTIMAAPSSSTPKTIGPPSATPDFSTSRGAPDFSTISTSTEPFSTFSTPNITLLKEKSDVTKTSQITKLPIKKDNYFSKTTGLRPIITSSSITDYEATKSIETRLNITTSKAYIPKVIQKEDPRPTFRKEDPKKTFQKGDPKGPIISMQHSSEEKSTPESKRFSIDDKEARETTQKLKLDSKNDKDWKIVAVSEEPELSTTRFSSTIPSEVEVLLSNVKKDLQDLNETITTTRGVSLSPTTLATTIITDNDASTTENPLMAELIRIRMNLKSLETQIAGIRVRNIDVTKSIDSTEARTQPTGSTLTAMSTTSRINITSSLEATKKLQSIPLEETTTTQTTLKSSTKVTTYGATTSANRTAATPEEVIETEATTTTPKTFVLNLDVMQIKTALAEIQKQLAEMRKQQEQLKQQNLEPKISTSFELTTKPDFLATSDGSIPLKDVERENPTEAHETATNNILVSNKGLKQIDMSLPTTKTKLPETTDPTIHTIPFEVTTHDRTEKETKGTTSSDLNRRIYGTTRSSDVTKNSTKPEESSKEILKNLMNGLIFLKEKIAQLAEEKINREEGSKKVNFSKPSPRPNLNKISIEELVENPRKTTPESTHELSTTKIQSSTTTIFTPISTTETVTEASTSSKTSTTVQPVPTLDEANFEETSKTPTMSRSLSETEHSTEPSIEFSTESRPTSTEPNIIESDWTSTAIVQIININSASPSTSGQKRPSSNEIAIQEAREVYKNIHMDQLPYLMEMKKVLEMLEKQDQVSVEEKKENPSNRMNPEMRAKIERILTRIKEELALMKKKGVSMSTTSKKSQDGEEITNLGSSTIQYLTTLSGNVFKGLSDSKLPSITSTKKMMSEKSSKEQLVTTTTKATTTSLTTSEPVVQLGSDFIYNPLHTEEISLNIDSPDETKPGRVIESVSSGEAKIHSIPEKVRQTSREKENINPVGLEHLYVQGKLPKNFVVVTSRQIEMNDTTPEGSSFTESTTTRSIGIEETRSTEKQIETTATTKQKNETTQSSQTVTNRPQKINTRTSSTLSETTITPNIEEKMVEVLGKVWASSAKAKLMTKSPISTTPTATVEKLKTQKLTKTPASTTPTATSEELKTQKSTKTQRTSSTSTEPPSLTTKSLSTSHLKKATQTEGQTWTNPIHTTSLLNDIITTKKFVVGKSMLSTQEAREGLTEQVITEAYNVTETTTKEHMVITTTEINSFKTFRTEQGSNKSMESTQEAREGIAEQKITRPLNVTETTTKGHTNTNPRTTTRRMPEMNEAFQTESSSKRTTLPDGETSETSEIPAFVTETLEPKRNVTILKKSTSREGISPEVVQTSTSPSTILNLAPPNGHLSPILIPIVDPVVIKTTGSKSSIYQQSGTNYKTNNPLKIISLHDETTTQGPLSFSSNPPNVVLPTFTTSATISSKEHRIDPSFETMTSKSEELITPKFIAFNPMESGVPREDIISNYPKHVEQPDASKSPLSRIQRLRRPEMWLTSTTISTTEPFVMFESESTTKTPTTLSWIASKEKEKSKEDLRQVKSEENLDKDIEIDTDVMDSLQSSLVSKESSLEKDVPIKHAIDSTLTRLDRKDEEQITKNSDIIHAGPKNEMPKLSTQEPINIFELVVPMNPNDPEFMSKNNIALRLEQARRLREEKTRLDMQASIQREAEFRAYQERRRLVEEKLAQLADTERWQRELLQKAQLRQRAFANANDGLLTTSTQTTTTTQLVDNNDWIPITASSLDSSSVNKKTPKHCEPVQRFVQVFKVRDPIQWLKENCVFVKQYFPTASCSQIQEVLSSCFVVKDS